MTRKSKDPEQQPDYTRGGFGEGRASMRSDTLRARLEELDAREDRLGRVVEAERQQLAEAQQEANITASIQLALDRGEPVDVRRAWADGGVGRTPGEVIAAASAQMEYEDVRAEHAEQAAFRKWLLDRSADASADTSAPTADEIDAKELMASRAAEYRRKRREKGKLLVSARALARMDRERR